MEEFQKYNCKWMKPDTKDTEYKDEVLEKAKTTAESRPVLALWLGMKDSLAAKGRKGIWRVMQLF